VCHTNKRVMLYISIRPVAYCNGSCHTYGWVNLKPICNVNVDAVMKVYVCVSVCVCNAVAVMKVSMKLDVTQITLDQEAGRTLTSTLKQSSKPYQVAQHPLQNWGHESVHENRRYTNHSGQESWAEPYIYLKVVERARSLVKWPSTHYKDLSSGPAPTTKMHSHTHTLQRWGDESVQKKTKHDLQSELFVILYI